MTDRLTSLPPTNTGVSRVINAAPQIKTIVFSIDTLKLALRIEAVYKVLKQTSIHGTEFNSGPDGDRSSVGIAHVGDREVTVLDLQQLFRTRRRDETVLSDRYLIIAQTKAGKLCGIPVETVPALMEVPLSTVRVLPNSYQRAANLDVVSHVAVIPQEEGNLTLFFVDVEQLPA